MTQQRKTLSAFAKNLRAARLNKAGKHRKLSQNEVAKAVFISRTLYNFLETGRREPPKDTLERIAAYFGTTPEELLQEKTSV